jgi:hypothetical protein
MYCNSISYKLNIENKEKLNNMVVVRLNNKKG